MVTLHSMSSAAWNEEISAIPGMKLLMKLAMAKRVPVASKKSTYRNVTSAIHREPLLKPLKLSAAPVLERLGTATTCLK